MNQVTKLSTMVKIDGQWYGPVTDTRIPGESSLDFSMRHLMHWFEWANRSFPEGTIEESKTEFS